MKTIEKPRLIFATNNKHKFEEIRHVIGERVELMRLADIGFNGEIPEKQETLDGNAAQKAFFIYNLYGIDCFADDTGLEIEALQGEPGTYSARYAGENCNFEDNMNKVLQKMKGVTDRKARFRTVIALVEKGSLRLFKGEIRGVITTEKLGLAGFGYDPIFMPDGFGETFAEMSLAQKNRISHRALAIQELLRYFTPNPEKS
ncbi:MAG: RdgB/HAM1 family non-canonical purine NTP pyrophosphatase [Bacteroidales bacterium]|nr:RdgB/HAM1 family non-canonical purine NTP pyrophosphatase [Bacteroidales bacterium]